MKNYVLFIGIDISKEWIDVSLGMDGHKADMHHKRFSNKKKGFNKLYQWLISFSKPRQIADQDWLFCMEYTGVYTIPLAYFLQNQDLAYVLESALRIRRSLGLKRGKDDKADSQDLARYAYLFRTELSLSRLPGEALMSLKNLMSFRARLVKQRNALRTPAREMQQFMPIQSCHSVMEDTEQIVALYDQKIRKVEKQMKQIVHENLELKQAFDLATSVKGVGLICGIQLLIHTNAFKAFDNYRKFACYIGIAPFAHRSGSSLNSPPKVSYLGQKKLKALFSNAAWVALKHDHELSAYYKRKIAQGKNKFSVLNAVKNKLIARVFATVNRGTPYVVLNRYTSNSLS